MTTRYVALIERWRDESLLFVRALPGFQIVAASPDDVLPRAREAIGHFLSWADERELIELTDTVVDLVVGEEAAAIGAGIGPRFVDDLIAPSEDEIELALATGRAAVSDLIDAYEETARGGDAVAADAVLRHVAERDRWYAGRLTDGVEPPDLGDPLDDLVAAAGDFEDAVDRLAAGDQADLVLSDGEEWTLAKLLRRRTGHVREHLIDLLPPS